MTNKDQSREAFEHNQRVAATRTLDDALQRQGVYLTWPTVTGLVDIVSAARSAPAAPVELPEPSLYSFNEQASIVVGDERKFTRTTYTKIKPDEPHTIWYTESQVRELLEKGGRQSAPSHPQTRMDAQLEAASRVPHAGWVAVPVEPTDAMLCTLMQWESDTGFSIKPEYRAMLAAAPKLPKGNVCWCQTCRPLTLDDMRMVLCPECGNKRCPRSTHHDNACTNSNEPGQPGSSWVHVKPVQWCATCIEGVATLAEAKHELSKRVSANL